MSLPVFVVLLCLCCMTTGQTPVAWLPHSGMITGSFQIILNSAAVSGNISYGTTWQPYTSTPSSNYDQYSFNVNYGKTFLNSPTVLQGIGSMQMDSGTSYIEVYHDYSSASLSYFTYLLSIAYPNHIIESTTMFLAFDKVVIDFMSMGFYGTDFTYISGGSGFRSQVINITFGGGRSFDLTHTNALFVWVTGFAISKSTNTGTLDLAIWANLTTSTTYDVTFATKGTTWVYYAMYNRLFFDITLVQTTLENFFDIGMIEGLNSAQTVWPNFVNYTSANFFAGLTNFSFSTTGSTQAQLKLQIGTPFTLSSTSGYSSIKFQYLNFRVRSCLSPSIFYRLQDQNCYQTCPPYTYVNTAYNFCYGCNYACYSCTDPGVSSCTGCNTAVSYRNLTTGQCKCLPGYYDSGVAICLACSYTCVTCNGTTNVTCLTCPTTRIFTTNACPCTVGYYDTGVATCSTCDYTCLTCNTSGTSGCLTCLTPTRSLVGNACPCVTGYYNAGVATCAVCNYTCATCAGTAANCTSCPITRNLTTSACPCLNSYYDNGVSTCLACNSKCANCTSTVCITCVDPNATPSGTTCICNSGYFTQANGSCTACPITCLNCTSATVCTACNTSNMLVLTSGACVCLTGYFLDTTNNCTACNISLVNCAQCADSAVCQACVSPQTLNLGICGCQPYQYMNGTTCMNCNATLMGCTACPNSTDCTSCDATLNWQLTGTSCTCLSTALFITANSTCPACTTFINGCSACSSQSVCTTCMAPQFVLSGFTCLCAVGYYPNGTNCSACDPTCLTCSGAGSSNCSTCNLTLFSLNSTNSCVCLDGTYFVAPASCSACFVSCLTCNAGAYNSCLTCANTLTQQGGQCICSNTSLYYNGSSCVPCYGSCLTCSAGLATNCLTCSTPMALNATSGTCDCPIGTFTNSSFQCQACDPTCLDCLGSPTNCTNCATPLVLTLGSCTCSQGQYLNLVSSVYSCPACDVICTNCTGPTSDNCTACTSPKVLNGSTCICAGSFFMNTTSGNCVACDPTCLTCTDTTNASCISCNTASFFLSTSSCVCYNGTYLVAPATCTPCHPSCLTCTAGTYSSCVTCSALLTFNAGQCLCSNLSQYYNGSSCVACLGSCATCSGGLSTNCITCSAPSVLNAATNSCDCPTGFFMNSTFQCQGCDPTCTSCSGSATICTSCTSPLILSAGLCTCTAGNYVSGSVGAYLCTACDVSCTTCSGGATTNCTSCTMPLVLSGTTCVCSVSTYIDSATGACLSCNSICLTCKGPATTDCVTCNPVLYRVINGTTCSCDITALQVGVPLCQFVGCPAGYANISDACVVICGDGIIINEACDDGNTVSGDGCSSTCAIQTNYTCDSASPTICSYNQPLSLTLLSTLKSITSNNVQFTIKIGPSIPALNTLDFSQVFSINLTGTNLTFSYDGNGTLIINAAYSSSIQGQNATLLFDPLGSSYFFWTPPSTANFTVDPDNNLAAEYYDAGVYDSVQLANILATALMYASLAGFAAGLVMAKFIGVEMIGVVQISFIGLMIINYLQPFLAPMAKIGFVNGVNTMLSNHSSVVRSGPPNRIKSLQYQPQMAVSMNYTIILLVLPLFVGLVLFVISKIWKSKSAQLVRYSMLAVCEFGLTAVVFVLYHMIVSLLVYAFYAGGEGSTSSLFPFSVGEAILTVGVSIAIAVLYNVKPDYFGDYKTAFRSGNKLSQNYYYILMGGRVVLAAAIIGANSIQYVGFICLVVPIASIVLLAVKKPYLHAYNNYRAIGNEAVVTVVLGSYGYYRSFVDFTSELTTINALLPYIDLGLLLLCVLANIAVMCKFQYDKCKANKIEEERVKKQQFQEVQKDEFDAQHQLNEQVKIRIRNMTAVKRPTLARPFITPKNFEPENLPEIPAQVQPSQPSPEGEYSPASPVRDKLLDKLLSKPKATNFECKQFADEEVLEIMNGFDAI